MQRYTPGIGGFARQASNDLEAYWLENMIIDRDGTYRPRWGHKHIYEFSGAGTHISREGGYTHYLMVVAASGKLYRVAVESPAPTEVATGWPTTPMASTIAVTSSGANAWIACKAGVGQASGSLYKYVGTTLTAIASPGNGNYVGMHGYFPVKIVSGVTDNTALRWGAIGDVDTWPVTSAKQPVPEIRSIDAIVPFSSRESLLFGPGGIAVMSGYKADEMSFAPVANVPVATPMNHIVKCRDEVYFLAPGPSICKYRHPGRVEKIDSPIQQLLYDADGVTNFRAWYNSQTNCYVLWDVTSYRGYNFDIDKQRFTGVTTWGGVTTNMLGYAAIDQGASAVDAADMPLGKGFLFAGAHLVQEDPTKFSDYTASNTYTAYNCRVETKPSFGAMDPSVEKQCHYVHVYGTGSWTVKLKYRSGPDAAFTTVTLGTVTAPGRVFPTLANMPAYTERTFLCEATAASGVRWASIAAEEVPVGTSAT